MAAGFSLGSPNTVAIAGGVVANTVLKTSTGRLGRVLITAAGAGAVTIYDNATTNGGTVIGITPANPTVGTMYLFDIPAANGITMAGGSTVPGVTVSFY